MKKFILSELRKKIDALLTEETHTDLFKFLETNPKNMTMGTAYYVNSMDSSMNKNLLSPDGVKTPNPMYGKLYKNSRFIFKWSDTYQKSIERNNPEHEIGKRSGNYEKVQGYEPLENGKSGLYLPIIPTGSESTYTVLENGQFIPIDKEEVKKYLRPSGPSQSASGVNFRPLIIDKVYKLTGGGNEWVNPNFKGQYMGGVL